MMSFQSRHHNYVIEKRHQNNVTIFFHFGPPPNKTSGYASGLDRCVTLNRRFSECPHFTLLLGKGSFHCTRCT